MCRARRSQRRLCEREGADCCSCSLKPQGYQVWAVGSHMGFGKAYRQLARSPCHARFAIFAVIDPSICGAKCFKMVALAFGASASVFALHWTAWLLCQILVSLFPTGASNFYVDCTIVEFGWLRPFTERSVGSVLELRGWAMEPSGSLRGSGTPWRNSRRQPEKELSVPPAQQRELCGRHLQDH